MRSDVSRRAIVWMLSVPLMIGGTEAAHWLAYRLVYPDGWERAQALQESGHGYSGWLPLLGGVAVAVLLSALFLHARDASTGRGPSTRRVRLSQFAALPPLAFACQEHLERLTHDGTVAGVALQPTFMIGLLLQLPFAVVAYLSARLLLRVADRVGRIVTGRNAGRPRVIPAALRPCFSFELPLPRLAALAGGHAERGPPV